AMRDAILLQIENLNMIMSRIMKVKSANQLTAGNLMISGKSEKGSPIHQIFNWPDGTRTIPKSRLYVFLSEWLSDLLMQHRKLSETLAAGCINFQGKSAMLYCHFCAKPTIHRNYFTIAATEGLVNIPAAAGSCICTVCDNIQFQSL